MFVRSEQIRKKKEKTPIITRKYAIVVESAWEMLRATEESGLTVRSRKGWRERRYPVRIGGFCVVERLECCAE